MESKLILKTSVEKAVLIFKFLSFRCDQRCSGRLCNARYQQQQWWKLKFYLPFFTTATLIFWDTRPKLVFLMVSPFLDENTAAFAPKFIFSQHLVWALTLQLKCFPSQKFWTFVPGQAYPLNIHPLGCNNKWWSMLKFLFFWIFQRKMHVCK